MSQLKNGKYYFSLLVLHSSLKRYHRLSLPFRINTNSYPRIFCCIRDVLADIGIEGIVLLRWVLAYIAKELVGKTGDAILLHFHKVTGFTE